MCSVMLIDISPSISSTLAVYPSDTAFKKTLNTSFDAGDGVTTSHFTTTSHLGAHVDGACHYTQDGVGVDQWPLERFVGPCEVLTINMAPSTRITPDQLPPTSAPRILFATGTYPDPSKFTTDFAAIHPDTVHELASRGVTLIGIDTPSVDRFSDTALPAHQAFAACNITILEGLVLNHVRPGPYELIALPLRIQDGDASPVRAVLRVE